MANIREELQERGKVEIDEEETEPSPREVDDVDDRAEAAEHELKGKKPIAERKHCSKDALT